MVIIFDLDDTLYNEKSFVFSGFNEVAKWISSCTSISQNEIYNFMCDELAKNGRGAIFDRVLEKYSKLNKTNVKRCINIYRLHQPNIHLEANVIALLNELRRTYPLYIVTDGHKLVQSNKVKALGVERYVKKAFITYRYGLKASKPSLICFEKIRKTENVNWNEIIYIGDNPMKDFVNLNKVNATTVRVRQGDYKNVFVEESYDAKFNINCLTEIKEILINEIK